MGKLTRDKRVRKGFQRGRCAQTSYLLQYAEKQYTAALIQKHMHPASHLTLYHDVLLFVLSHTCAHISTQPSHTHRNNFKCVCVCAGRGISANRLLYSPPAGEQIVCKSSARLFVLKSPYRGHCLCLLCSVGEDIPLAASLLQLWQSSAIGLESL